MNNMGTKTLMTVEQFAQMHTADTEDYELVEGELIPLSSGTYLHNRIRDLIVHLLWSYFKGNPIGAAVAEYDCRIAPDTVRRPDLSIFFLERLRQIVPDHVPAPLAPDIAVEILSPSESAVDIRRKVRDYLRAGSSEVWLVDHSNGEVQLHTAAGIRVLQATDVLESPLLPAFSVAVASLVAPPSLVK
jgi:Uma2 family endonuclease